MGEDINVVKGELHNLAGRLRHAADGMDGTGEQAPEGAPDAGSSTGALAAFLGCIQRSTAALTETAAKAAGDVDVAAKAYSETDHGNTGVFKNLDGATRGQ